MIAALANNPSLLGPDRDLPDDTADPTPPVDAEGDNADDDSGEPDGPNGADIYEAALQPPRTTQQAKGRHLMTRSHRQEGQPLLRRHL